MAGGFPGIWFVCSGECIAAIAVLADLADRINEICGDGRER
jgi:hypothetical protein